ncbi:hypothetical protein EHE19_007825 [Ruminiclostridium herbifermentans]|uniref:Uncharacterized protein n=1 Tax=Ruminiclostridium herbifermentans TaxID=2488810 RepID=A0A7H1VSE1_9FIRM|nr:hypothetical protein [Ruminiclostridium herbifermentans]QNU68303.1 hypothetical protein EHE19_007825 [Ruminiclostridium herbifermentans]
MSKNIKQYILKKVNKKTDKIKSLKPKNAQSWIVLSDIYFRNWLHEKAIEAATKTRPA